MLLNFYQLNNKQDSGKFNSIRVALITKWMGLPRTEDPSWKCLSDMLYGHVLVEVDSPRVDEYGSYVVIPCLHHLNNLPKLINIGWGVSFIEPKFNSYGVKSAFRHESP